MAQEGSNSEKKIEAENLVGLSLWVCIARKKLGSKKARDNVYCLQTSQYTLNQNDLKEKDEFILFFKIVQGKTASAARN